MRRGGDVDASRGAARPTRVARSVRDGTRRGRSGRGRGDDFDAVENGAGPTSVFGKRHDAPSWKRSSEMQSFGECDEWSFLVAMVMTTLSMKCCVLSAEHRRVFVRGSWACAGTFGESSFVKNRRKRHTVCDSTEKFVITTQITSFRIDMSLGKGIIASFRSFQQLSVLARKPPFPSPKKTRPHYRQTSS